MAAQQADSSLRQRYSREGQHALAQKRYAEAEQAYQSLVQLDPGVAEAHANLGLVYFQEGKFAEAVPTLRQALKLRPGLASTECFLAISLSELGRYEEALPGLQKGFRFARDPGLKRLAGLHLERAYTGLRRDGEAVQVALELIRLYPNDPEILYQTGRLCGNFAYLAMQKLSEVAPDSPWRHQASGELFESQGHDDLAIREYRAVLALDPRRPGIHYRLGRVLLARSRQSNSSAAGLDAQAQALKEFEEELDLDPTNANAAYEAGEIHRKSGQLERAREYFETALRYYPGFEEAQIGLGRVLIAQKKAEMALLHLRKAISQDPKSEIAYYQLALAYGAMGNTTEQQKAQAEFQSLRIQKAREQKSLAEDSSSQEATKQELDSKDAPRTRP